MNNDQTAFAPMLYIQKGVKDVSFYQDAFGAIELQRWSNDDGTVHVAELSINGAVFHIHEVTQTYFAEPITNNATTVSVGLFVPDVHAFMKRAVEAGAIEISPTTDYEYGYRQGELKDPFGHHWIIEARI